MFVVKLHGFCLSIAYIARRRHPYIQSLPDSLIYMKIPPFESLVWGSLRLAPITHSVVGFKPKKFDLVHQSVSPRERVGSGDETRIR